MTENFDQVKVFSATMARDREHLGERVTDWIRSSPGKVVDKVVTQSSDREFHCISITLFMRKRRRDVGRTSRTHQP